LHEFSHRYKNYLNSEDVFPFLLKLSRESVEYDLNEDYKGIVLQCVCQHSGRCHRSLLADKIREIVKDRYNRKLRIYDL